MLFKNIIFDEVLSWGQELFKMLRYQGYKGTSSRGLRVKIISDWSSE
jgi:hypothetical protein